MTHRDPTSHWPRSILTIAFAMPLLALLLFVPAGRLDWVAGWVFLLVMMAGIGISTLLLARINPDIFVARRRVHEGTERWDWIFILLIFASMVAVPVVAALDAGRRDILPSIGVTVAGYFLFAAGFALMAWAQAVNRYFESGVRMQAERGHRVIDTGPYAAVRHPGYVGAVLLFVGTALALGSYRALIPAAILAVVLIVRTAWEDRFLQTNLPGYSDYARRVRSRLVPGVW